MAKIIKDKDNEVEKTSEKSKETKPKLIKLDKIDKKVRLLCLKSNRA